VLKTLSKAPTLKVGAFYERGFSMFSYDKAYCYPKTNVLVNKFGIKNFDELSKTEEIITIEKIRELQISPVKGSFDIEHLKTIHKYIFQDIYEWAGKLRTVDIAKGNTLFALERHLESTADYIFTALKKENNLLDIKVTVDQYTDRLAFYSGEINMLHPFREGNGRSLREFLRCLANEAGYELNWSGFDRKAVYNAFVKSTLDHKPLKEEFKKQFLENERKWYVNRYPHACFLSSGTLEKCISINRAMGKKQNLGQIKNLGDIPIHKDVLWDIVNDFKEAALKYQRVNCKKIIKKIDLEL